MKRFSSLEKQARMVLVLILTVAAPLWCCGPALAADMTLHTRSATSPLFPPVDPIARSRAAQAVWASDVCWRNCTQQCNGDFRARLAFQGSSKALAHTDRCDRVCVIDCRTSGGPLLSFD